MRTKLRDLYRGILWSGVIGAVALIVVVATQPASFRDGLLLSVVLVSVFFVVMSAIACVGVSLRRRREIDLGERFVFGSSLRQGVLSGMAAVTLLILQLLRVVTLIDALLFVGLVVMVEFYLGSRTESQ